MPGLDRRRVDNRLGVVLLAMMIPLLIFSDVFGVLFICLGIGSVIALIFTFQMVSNYRQLRCCHVMCVSILMGYVLGAFNTLVRMWLGSEDQVDFHLIFDLSRISVTVVYIYMSCLMLLICSRFERPLFLRFVQTKFAGAERWVVFVTVAVVMVAIAKGELGFQGLKRGEEGAKMSVIGSLATMINVPAAGLCLYYAMQKNQKIVRVMLWVLFVVFEMFLLVQGRRIFLFNLIVLLIIGNIKGFAIRKPSFKVGMVLGVVGAMAIFSLQFFFAMRNAGYTYNPIIISDYSLVTHAERAYEMMTEGGERTEELNSRLEKNLEERTFIIGFLADIINVIQENGPLYGEIFTFSFEMAIPSALHPDKSRVMEIGGEEPLLNMHYDLSEYRDGANTIMTAGAADFGTLGVLLYPSLLALYYSFVVRLGAIFFSGSFRLIFPVVAVYQLLSIEEQMITHFSTIRNLLLLVLMTIPVYRVIRGLSIPK